MDDAMPGRPATSQSWFGFMFSPFGRVPRKQYWLSYVLPVVFLYIVATIADAVIMGDSLRRGAPIPYAASTIVGLFLLWPSFAVTAKRLHDRGISGWWSVLSNGFFPVVILAVAAYWYVSTRMKGDATAQDPTLGVVILGGAALFGLAWLFLTIQILFVRGQEGSNKYGDDPLPTAEEVRTDGTVTAVFAVLAVALFFVPFLASTAYYYQATRSDRDVRAVESAEEEAPSTPPVEPATTPAAPE